ncbi:Immediate-early protein 2 [Streptomyces oceani]|uniref:Immediate-early protein 2 n=1 Tax=Streptomyces oceani TaxID=1075402 RepID=A0A1E7JXI3_9ACTN|nr:Immediate-early protein 2 [Streptomyces oceani]OEU96317.1 Immediate-early protein 2 [Streptomyces oceani]
MALFRVERTSALPVGECWRRVTRWRRHADTVPFTRIIVRTRPPDARGTVFVARTALGPFGFDDPMEVVDWRPPTEAGSAPEPDPGPAARARTGGAAEGWCRLVKRGRVVTGWAEITVRTRAGGSQVVWREDMRVRFLPRTCDPLLVVACRLVFGRALDSLLSTGTSAERER